MTPPDLDPLLRPKSIAILGATERPSIARSVMRSLDRLGFDGDVLPINPKYEIILGHDCVPSLQDLQSPPDVVVFCVSRERTLAGVTALPDCGAHAAVIYGGGYAEVGREGERLQAEIAGICGEADIALLGPNCMGALSPWDKSSTYMSEFANTDPLPGSVGFVSQSGSITIGMLVDPRRFGFSHIISSGNEAVVTTADYLEFLIDDPRTRCIGLFVESANEPERFVAALDRAARADKPVVVLKVGRSARAQRSVTSHTGALAGSARVFSEVLRAHRAIEVHDMEEMVEVLAMCQADNLPQGRHIAVITASGGHAELILDIADAGGVELPPLTDLARSRIEACTGPITGDGNPVDAWGSGEFAPSLENALDVLKSSGRYDAIGLCMDTGDHDVFGNSIVEDATRSVAASGRDGLIPHFVVGTRPGQVTGEQIATMRDAGQVCLTGLGPALKAIDRLGRWSSRAVRSPCTEMSNREVSSGIPEFWSGRASIHEFDSKVLMSDAGLPVTRETIVDNLQAARRAAGRIGFPVVLKVLGDRIPHRTEYGLVETGIGSESSLSKAWDRMGQAIARLPEPGLVQGFLVQEMAGPGVEVFAGVSRDPQFGLTLSFGIGGALIEVLDDVAIRLLPLADGDAEEMIDEIRGRAVLGPVRGRPTADIAALVRCLYALSDFARDHEPWIEEIDLNPILAMPDGAGCVVVDALVVPRSVQTNVP